MIGFFKRKIYGIEIEALDGDVYLLSDSSGKTMEFMTIQGACNSLRLWVKDNRGEYTFCKVIELK